MPKASEKELSHDELTQSLLYDLHTGLFVWNVKKLGVKYGSVAGTIRPDGYIGMQLNCNQYLAQRLAWFYIHGKWPTQYIDHINGIRADNRISNLREVDKEQDAKNRGIFKNNKTGFMGVCWDKNRKKYAAQITVKGKLINLGRYKQILNAIKVRKEAEIQYGFHVNHGRRPSHF